MLTQKSVAVCRLYCDDNNNHSTVIILINQNQFIDTEITHSTIFIIYFHLPIIAVVLFLLLRLSRYKYSNKHNQNAQ